MLVKAMVTERKKQMKAYEGRIKGLVPLGMESEREGRIKGDWSTLF